MNVKKELLEKCKRLVDQVKLSDHNMSQHMRKVSKEVSEQLEVERKKFRAGQEARQRKVWRISQATAFFAITRKPYTFMIDF